MSGQTMGTELTRRGATRRTLLRTTAVGLGALALAPALSACGMIPGMGGPSGIYSDVSDLYAEFGKAWGGWYKPAQQLATKDGKQYMLPYSLDSNLILYRKDILDAGGIKEAPKTWDELFEVAKKLQQPPNLYGVGFQFNKAGTDAEDTFRLMMLGYGAAIVKEDGKLGNVKSPEMLEFLKRLKSSWDMGVYPPGVTGWDNASNNTALQDEKVIFINNPASPLVWFRTNKPDMLPKIGVAAVPGGKGSWRPPSRASCWATRAPRPRRTRSSTAGRR